MQFTRWFRICAPVCALIFAYSEVGNLWGGTPCSAAEVLDRTQDEASVRPLPNSRELLYADSQSDGVQLDTAATQATVIARQGARGRSTDHQDSSADADSVTRTALSLERVIDFIEAYRSSTSDPARHDLNGDGMVDGADYQTTVELYAEIVAVRADATDPLGQEPRARCCEAGGVCDLYVDNCPLGTTQVPCPCNIVPGD